jgi:hypothetical protein
VSRSRALDEAEADLVRDGYGDSELEPRAVTALRLADAVLVDPSLLDAGVKDDLVREFGAAGTLELGVSIGMFMSMSKVLIAFGLEPLHMETTVLEAPVASSAAVDER